MMYQYTEYDQNFLRERVAEFREQTERRLNDQLSEDEYKQLRSTQRAVLAAKSLYVTGSHSIRTAIKQPAAKAWPHSSGVRQRLRAHHHQAEHSVQLATA